MIGHETSPIETSPTSPIDNSQSGTSGAPGQSPNIARRGQGPAIYTQDHPSIASTQVAATQEVPAEGSTAQDVPEGLGQDAGMEDVV